MSAARKSLGRPGTGNNLRGWERRKISTEFQAAVQTGQIAQSVCVKISFLRIPSGWKRGGARCDIWVLLLQIIDSDIAAKVKLILEIRKVAQISLESSI